MHSRSTIARVIGVFGLSSVLGATSAVVEGYSFIQIKIPGQNGSVALALNNVGQVVGGQTTRLDKWGSFGQRAC